MKTNIITFLVLVLASPAALLAQERPVPAEGTFESAAARIHRQLEESVAELNELRERIVSEKKPLGDALGALEEELSAVRLEYQQTTRLLNSRTLDLSNLKTEIKSRSDESAYLSNLLSEYLRNFESRLHIAELNRYEQALETARLAPENANLSDQEIYEAQASLLAVSLERLHEALGGTRFDGTAVDSTGLVKQGSFVLVGPAALFLSEDGREVGTSEQRLGSLEPAVIGFTDPADTAAAKKVVAGGKGLFPLDPTLGNAHKVEATKESLIEHIKKGGPVMVPIFVMAGAALLVALYKWLSLAFHRKAPKKRVKALLSAVANHDEEGIEKEVLRIGGVVGKMLSVGVRHIREPRDLIEETMYETVIKIRLRLQRFLPFIAICAAAAPLLGLLGTVTGIINTFKLITVFGSGDVKTLSGGISEALITTEFGLIVAIPSLLLHSFLSRKARSIVGQMESAALAFVNQVSRTPFARTNGVKTLTNEIVEPAPRSATPEAPEAPASPAAASREAVSDQVKEILSQMLAPLASQQVGQSPVAEPFPPPPEPELRPGSTDAGDGDPVDGATDIPR